MTCSVFSSHPNYVECKDILLTLPGVNWMTDLYFNQLMMSR